MTEKRIFAAEAYIADRLKNEGGFERVKLISTASNPQTALSGAPTGQPVLIVAPLEGDNAADESLNDMVLLEKQVAVVVLVKGLAEKGHEDEDLVHRVIDCLHGYPFDDPDLSPVAFKRYEGAYDGSREYTLYFNTRLAVRFAR